MSTIDQSHRHAQVEPETVPVNPGPQREAEGFLLSPRDWLNVSLAALAVIALFYAFVLLGAATIHPEGAMPDPAPTPRHLAVRTDGLTVDEAAKQLHVHPLTIRNWINKGQLPATRFGPGRGVIRIHPDDLQEYGGGH